MSIRLRSRRGPIGTTEPAVSLRENLEALLGPERIRRGRAPAREGRVQWLDVAPGAARADVRDDLGEIRSARLDLAPLRSGDREAVLRLAHARPDLPARLLAGEFPADLAEALRAEEIALVPASTTDVWHDCSCLDWPGPCRHVAALVYVLVEDVEEHPEHLLLLRGITLRDLTAPPRASRAGDAGMADADGAGRPDEDGTGAIDESGDDSDPCDGDPGPTAGAFDARTADARLLVDALGPEAARVLARFYGAGLPHDQEPGGSAPDREPGRTVDGG